MAAMGSLRRVLGRPPSRECAHVGRLLQQYLDGEIDEEAAQRVAAHLEICRHCGLEAETYRRLKAALAGQGGADESTLARLREFVDDLAGGRLVDGADTVET